MPMCAALSAGASFTPSPVIATTSPLAFSARTRRSFCSGTTRQKIFDVPQPLLQLLLVERSSSAPVITRRRSASPIWRAMFSAVCRMVAGDHDHSDSRPRWLSLMAAGHSGTHGIVQRRSSRGSRNRNRAGLPAARSGESRPCAIPSTRSPARGEAVDLRAHRIGSAASRQDGTDPRWLRAHPWRRPRTAARSGERQTRDIASSSGRQRILLDQSPVIVQVLGRSQAAPVRPPGWPSPSGRTGRDDWRGH